MKHISVLLIACFATSAHAATSAELQNILAQPLEQRLSEIKRLKPQAYAFLSQTAFTRTNGLQMRWRALTTMGRVDAIFFRKDIEKALVSTDWFMRNAALIALQTDDRTHAVQWSARLLNDPALVVRTQAVRNLIQFEAREAEPLLWKQIFSPTNFRGKESLWVRVHMAEALAKFTVPGRAKSFQRLLLDPDERLHKWAVLGLENTTGFKMSERGEAVEIRRQKWLTRLGVQEI